MLHLLGVSFFILSIIAVYTANLASILAQRHSYVGVAGLDEAISRGYRICAERRTAEIVRSLKPELADAERFFAADPVDLGGDGLPGFNCCGPRRKVFEMLDPVRAQSDSRYCHVAIAPAEDLEVEQGRGEYCNLRAAGDTIGQVQIGMPVFERVSAEVTSLFLKMKNDGVLEKMLNVVRPEPNCPLPPGGDGTALTVQQLSGLWVVAFGFATLGLIVTFTSPWVNSWRQKAQRHPIVEYDQKGNPINMMEQYRHLWLQELRRRPKPPTRARKSAVPLEEASLCTPREEPLVPVMRDPSEPLDAIAEDANDLLIHKSC